MSKITGLKPGKTREKRINVILDGKPAIALLAETVLKAGLQVGQELTESSLEALAGLDRCQRCRNAAVRFLAYRPRSEAEIRQRLLRRGFPDAEIEKTVARLKEQGLIDDIAFAHFWRDNRQEFSPRSRRLTELELKRKGLSTEAIEQAVSHIDDHESAYQAALARARRLSTEDYRDFRQRLGGFLGRRGFSYGVIDETTKRLWRERHQIPEDNRSLKAVT
ncbi:MAG: regulatory protein RecX [Dehalococcoidales bacterium]|jgi:regulatory protein